MKDGELAGCCRCPRLVAARKDNALRYPQYWNRPVPASGSTRSRLLIVGLAPGLHGANRTGRPFTGDSAGGLLRDSLHRAGLDGRYRITNAVKCWPPQNRPLGQEIANCRGWLRAELSRFAVLAQGRRGRNRVVLVLGRVAHEASLRALGLTLAGHRFRHAAEHIAGERLVMLDSYHCSRYNVNTGRLTQAMLDAVTGRAAELLDAAPVGSADC